MSTQPHESSAPCDACDGYGHWIELRTVKRCPVCKGSGIAPPEEND